MPSREMGCGHRVPLAKLIDHADKVRSLMQGRAGYTMEPRSYAPAPEDVLRGFLGHDFS
jgi:elongation factor G